MGESFDGGVGEGGEIAGMSVVAVGGAGGGVYTFLMERG